MRADPSRTMNRLLRSTCLALACAFSPLIAATAQTGPAPQQPAQPLPQGWIPLDGVAIVVNSDTITRRAIERYIEEAMTKTTVTTREEYLQLAQEAQRKQVESLLVRQAGEDLGFPPEMVDAHVSGMLKDRQKDAGGTFEMSQKLRQEETTATEIREELTQETLEMEWKRKIAGFGGPGARTAEDRYSRPGTLAQHYRRMQRTGRDLDPLLRLGARAATYELQVLLIHGQSYGSLEEARRVADQAHIALSNGDADWDDMIANLGNYENQGLTGPRRIEEIQFALDPGDNSLTQFVMEGDFQSISEVAVFPELNPTTGQRRAAGFAIYKLIDRKPAVLPDYQEPGVQRELRRMLGYIGDELRIKLALEDLERTAYIWFPGIEEQAAEYEKRLEKRRADIEEARRLKAAELEAQEESQPETESAPPATEPEKPADDTPVEGDSEPSGS